MLGVVLVKVKTLFYIRFFCWSTKTQKNQTIFHLKNAVKAERREILVSDLSSAKGMLQTSLIN